MAKNIPQESEISNISIINTGTSITGDINVRGDIRIDGSVNGKISVQGKIVLGNSGKIEGELNANNADISGNVSGLMNISEILTMKSASRIEGDIKVGKIVIEQGAVFIGNCQMENNSETKSHISQTIE